MLCKTGFSIDKNVLDEDDLYTDFSQFQCSY